MKRTATSVFPELYIRTQGLVIVMNRSSYMYIDEKRQIQIDGERYMKT